MMNLALLSLLSATAVFEAQALVGTATVTMGSIPSCIAYLDPVNGTLPVFTNQTGFPTVTLNATLPANQTGFPTVTLTGTLPANQTGFPTFTLPANQTGFPTITASTLPANQTGFPTFIGNGTLPANQTGFPTLPVNQTGFPTPTLIATPTWSFAYPTNASVAYIVFPTAIVNGTDVIASIPYATALATVYLNASDAAATSFYPGPTDVPLCEDLQRAQFLAQPQDGSAMGVSAGVGGVLVGAAAAALMML